MKCFNQQKDEFALDLEQINDEINSRHKSSLINQFEEIDHNLSIDELICKIECPCYFIPPIEKQIEQIILFDKKQ